MSNPTLAQVEAKLDELIARHRRLSAEYAELKTRERQWQEDKARLIEENQAAHSRIEALIERIRQLEANQS